MLSVQEPDPVIEEGLQLASMPAGIPLSTRATVPLNPLVPETATVKLVLLPAVIVCEPGVAEMEKSGGGLFAETMTLTVVLWLRVPLDPPIVRVYVPAATLLVVPTVIVAVPDVVIEEGLKLAVMPEGNPLAVSDTAPVNPFDAETVTLKEVLFPAPTVCEPGAAEMEKSGGGLFAVTVRPTVVV